MSKVSYLALGGKDLPGGSNVFFFLRLLFDVFFFFRWLFDVFF